MKYWFKVLFFLWLISGCLFFSETAGSQTSTGNVISTAHFLTPKDGLAGKLVNYGLQDSKELYWIKVTTDVEELMQHNLVQ